MTDKQKYINSLYEEAEANLTLYTNGQDDYAINRYHQIIEYIRALENGQANLI